MLYTDGIHLMSDSSIEELHTFANSIGLHRNYFHERTKGHPHYDLTNQRVKLLAKYTAKTVTTRELIELYSHLNKK